MLLLGSGVGVHGLFQCYPTHHAYSIHSPPSHNRPRDVGVISPYLAQVRHLRDCLSRDLGPSASELDVNTIDGYQGREKDVVIFSAVRTGASGAIGFVADERRMNVGLTRGRCSVIVMGNAPALRWDLVGGGGANWNDRILKWMNVGWGLGWGCGWGAVVWWQQLLLWWLQWCIAALPTPLQTPHVLPVSLLFLLLTSTLVSTACTISSNNTNTPPPITHTQSLPVQLASTGGVCFVPKRAVSRGGV